MFTRAGKILQRLPALSHFWNLTVQHKTEDKIKQNSCCTGKHTDIPHLFEDRKQFFFRVYLCAVTLTVSAYPQRATWKPYCESQAPETG